MSFVDSRREAPELQVWTLETRPFPYAAPEHLTAAGFARLVSFVDDRFELVVPQAACPTEGQRHGNVFLAYVHAEMGAPAIPMVMVAAQHLAAATPAIAKLFAEHPGVLGVAGDVDMVWYGPAIQRVYDHPLAYMLLEPSPACRPEVGAAAGASLLSVAVRCNAYLLVGPLLVKVSSSISPDQVNYAGRGGEATLNLSYFVDGLDAVGLATYESFRYDGMDPVQAFEAASLVSA